MHVYVYIFPKQSSAVGVLMVLYKGPCLLHPSGRALGQLCALSFLCAGCENGGAHAAPVYAKRLVAVFFDVKNIRFNTFYIKNLFGALGASG